MVEGPQSVQHGSGTGQLVRQGLHLITVIEDRKDPLCISGAFPMGSSLQIRGWPEREQPWLMTGLPVFMISWALVAGSRRLMGWPTGSFAEGNKALAA